MKQKITFLFALCIAHLTMAQIVNIPDPNFKSKLLTGVHAGIDTNNDGEIQYSEAAAFTDPINVGNSNISDLTGIEAFTNITILACEGNNLTKLNVSQNTKLEMLFAMGNQIEKLDLKQNSNLKLVYVYNNNLKRLNIANGNNSNITTFYSIQNPNLKCIEIDFQFTPPSSWVKDNIAGYSVGCPAESVGPDKGFPSPFTPMFRSASNQIVNIPDPNFKNALLTGVHSGIDTNNDGEIQYSEAAAHSTGINVGNLNISDLTGIEAFTNITVLACHENNLTKLDLSQNKKLKSLFVMSNQIEKINLKHNPDLEVVYLSDNNLSRVKIANGNNANIQTLYTNLNPNLECIEIDFGFTPPTGSSNSWLKDSTANYSTGCPVESVLPDKGGPTPFTPMFRSTSNQNVSIPDPNFKNALLNHSPAIDTNNDGEIQYTEAAAFTTLLQVGSKNINTLIGIEAFVNLTWLNCAGNNLTHLNLSQNTALEFLYSAGNQLESLDLTKNPNLRILYTWENNLKRLDVANGNNSSITNFDAHNNGNLKCIQIDSGFTPSGWYKPGNAIFSSQCLYTADAALPDKGFPSPLPLGGFRSNNSNVIVYPNPATSSLTIADRQNSIEHIEVYGLDGRQLINSKEQRFDISILKEGIYEVKIYHNDKHITSKRIIKK